MEFKRSHTQRRRVAPNVPRQGSSITVVAPALPESSRTRPFFFRKPVIISAIVVCCVVGGIFIRNIANGDSNAAQAPTYKTALPKGKSVDELGGWKRVSPPKNDPVFAYADMIDGVPVSVSEQPLPQSFKSDASDQVAELAQKFNATDKINAGDITVYVGTSAKGPQSVIFAKNNLLILIKSEKKVADTSWATYAATLQFNTN